MNTRIANIVLYSLATQHFACTVAFVPSLKKDYSFFKVSNIKGTVFELSQQNEPINGEIDYNSMTVLQLKDELKKNGLKISGKKDELVQRLEEYLMKEKEETLSSLLDESMESALQFEEEDDSSKPSNIDLEIENASFSDLTLMDSLLESISMQGWVEPTPVQKLAIPAIINHFSDMNGNNDSSCCSIWAEAPTGSGKVSNR